MSKNLEPLNASFTAFSSPEKDTDLKECGICSKTFKTKATLRRHLNLHNEYICKTCSQSFETNRELEDHKATKHCDTYLCSICGKSFNRRSGLNAHNKLNLERVEVCPFEQCGKSFINKHQLADHLNGHTGNKPYTCRRCKRSYATQPSYCHHKSVCMRKVKFNECDRSFSIKSTLFDHKKSEHEVSWFKCNCDKRYRWRTNLPRHKRTYNSRKD